MHQTTKFVLINLLLFMMIFTVARLTDVQIDAVTRYFLIAWLAVATILLVLTRCRLKRGQPNNEIERLMAYFGLSRSQYYRPEPKKEGQEIMDLLRDIRHPSAQALYSIAWEHSELGVLPLNLSCGSKESRYMGYIYDVCETLKQQEVTVA